MPWITRGLRHGVVTSRYPRRSDGYGDGFSGGIAVSGGVVDATRLARCIAECPTGAITIEPDGPVVDRGRCIHCGRCVDVAPEVFSYSSGVETARTRRQTLVVPTPSESDESLAALRARLSRRTTVLRRSVHVRHVDAGSDGSDEWEVAALTNPTYDVQRLGIFFTASPRHADVLLVTGVATLGMRDALVATYEAMAAPKVVVAAGVEAISGGLFSRTYASLGGVDSVLPVDVYVPGAPATPFGLLHGILVAVSILAEPAGEPT
jgi:Ni,Fe-hydrogenase III small subunit/ferredoxin